MYDKVDCGTIFEWQLCTGDRCIVVVVASSTVFREIKCILSEQEVVYCLSYSIIYWCLAFISRYSQS